MKLLNEWLLKPLIIIIILPFFIILSCIGFIHCWQCHRVLHFLKSEKYHLISFGSERVCRDCYDLLTTRRLKR